MSKKPLIHLWIYNHPFYGISDQIDYFVAAFLQNGYEVTVGRQPKISSLNVVIENFSIESKDVLIKFCQTNNKNVAVIMTEHLDLIDRQIYIHGEPIWTRNDYMDPTVQVDRIGYLLECSPYITSYFVLGDLPELQGFSDLLPSADVRSIPFPEIDFVSSNRVDPQKSSGADFLFTGVMTNYRKDVFSMLKAENFLVNSPWGFVSRKRRDLMTRSAKFVLNIPQRTNWRWLSLQRVIAGLRSGRATVSLGTFDTSKISTCTYQLDMTSNRRHLPTPPNIQNRWTSDLNHYLLSSQKGYNIIEFRKKIFGVAQIHGSINLSNKCDRELSGTVVANNVETVVETIKSRPVASFPISILSKILRRLKLTKLRKVVDPSDPSNFNVMYLDSRDIDSDKGNYMSETLDDVKWDWPQALKEYLLDSSVLYEQAYENYISMVNEDKRLGVFPHDIIEYWAITDRIVEN